MANVSQPSNWASLTSFYLAGNYFVVREMSIYMFGSSQNTGEISMGWLFWILTAATPPFLSISGYSEKRFSFLMDQPGADSSHRIYNKILLQT